MFHYFYAFLGCPVLLHAFMKGTPPLPSNKDRSFFLT
jgi:hypothetical protein